MLTDLDWILVDVITHPLKKKGKCKGLKCQFNQCIDMEIVVNQMDWL